MISPNFVGIGAKKFLGRFTNAPPNYNLSVAFIPSYPLKSYVAESKAKDKNKDTERPGHAATRVPFHNFTLSNYNEVRDTLAGTEFEILLH
jgi:hypothetical protein